MKKTDVEFHRLGYGSESVPALNIKVYNYGTSVSKVSDAFGCSEKCAEQALEFARESAQENFWELAQDAAEYVFGKGYEVYSEGRSGGWLYVDGLPDFESWDAIMLSKWTRFAKNIQVIIADLTSRESIHDSIEANQWAKEGAELYNFIEFKDGETACIADMKQQAIEAGFASVVRA